MSAVSAGPRLAVRGEATLADGTECVLLARDDYEAVLAQLEQPELAEKLAAPAAEWVDFDRYKRQVAGSLVTQARKARGLTQVQLARRLKLPQSQISRIERNPERTTVRTLKRVARALGVEVGALLR